MRISTAMLYNNMKTTGGSLTENLQKINSQLSSGKKVETSADDPVNYYKADVLKSKIAELSVKSDNLNNIKYRASAVEQKISAGIDLMADLRDWVVAAKSDNRWESSAAQDKDIISGFKEQLLNIANSKNENGDYMFSGFQNTTPFINTAAGVAYAGDQGVRTLSVDNREIQLEPSGDKIFNIAVTSKLDVSASVNWYGGSQVGSSSLVVQSTATLVSDLSVVFAVDRSVSPITTKMDILDNTGTSIINGTNRVTGTNQVTPLPLSVVSGSTIDISSYLGQPANTTQVSINGVPEDGDMHTISNSTKQSVFNIFDDILSEMNKPLVSTGTLSHNNLNAAIQNLPSNVGKQGWQPVLDRALTKIDAWVSSVNAERSKLGAIQTYTDSELTQTGLINNTLEAQRSDLEDLDYGLALMKQTQISTQLQALYKSYNTTSSLSLFNFIA